MHFWIYDDVTDNCILDLQRKLNARNAFLSCMPWDHVLFLKEHQKNMWNKSKMACAEKDLPKVTSTVVFLIHSEWSDFWIFANFRYVMIFSGFEKITPRYKSKFSWFLCKQNWYARDTLVHMHGLWKSVKWVILAPFVNWSLVSFNLELFVLQGVYEFLNPKSVDYTVKDSKLYLSEPVLYLLLFVSYLEVISCALCNCFVRKFDDFLLCFVTRSCRMLDSHG